jgi:hypothetical protein
LTVGLAPLAGLIPEVGPRVLSTFFRTTLVMVLSGVASAALVAAAVVNAGLHVGLAVLAFLGVGVAWAVMGFVFASGRAVGRGLDDLIKRHGLVKKLAEGTIAHARGLARLSRGGAEDGGRVGAAVAVLEDLPLEQAEAYIRKSIDGFLGDERANRGFGPRAFVLRRVRTRALRLTEKVLLTSFRRVAKEDRGGGIDLGKVFEKIAEGVDGMAVGFVHGAVSKITAVVALVLGVVTLGPLVYALWSR